MKDLPKTIYDYYENGLNLASGTAQELAKELCITIKSVYYLAKIGRESYENRKNKRFVVVNDEKTLKKYPDYDFGLGKLGRNTDEILDEERRKIETKAERRLRRNIRVQMAIEALRDERNVLN